MATMNDSTTGEPTKYLLLMDSRGTEMQSEINKQLKVGDSPYIITVDYLGGGTLETITDMGMDRLKREHFAGCLLFAGINNVTRKIGKQCQLRQESINSTVLYILSELEKAYMRLSRECPKVIICHLLGLDISKYNKAQKCVYEREQSIINDSVSRINLEINQMNITHEVKGPWLADTIHSTTGTHTTHKYKMLPDGLHPDSLTTKIWAKKIIASLI